MLSVTSEYALRALVGLAESGEGARVLGLDLAVRTGVPKNYLSKIMLSLRNAGLVQSVRGTGGGYRLLKSPAKISLGEVVEIFEGSRSQSTCLLGHKPSCSKENPCSAHASWGEVRRVFLHFLESTTVADIARPSGLSPGFSRGNSNES